MENGDGMKSTKPIDIESMADVIANDQLSLLEQIINLKKENKAANTRFVVAGAIAAGLGAALMAIVAGGSGKKDSEKLEKIKKELLMTSLERDTLQDLFNTQIKYARWMRKCAKEPDSGKRKDCAGKADSFDFVHTNRLMQKFHRKGGKILKKK
ncbi:hypothetical protein ACFL3T_03890 [Patescibacteria group bacterium]